ncbi:MAG: FG-GAP repeat domain-containing protein [Flavobacteriales bacterium]
MTRIVLTITLLYFFSNLSFGQFAFERNYEIAVTKNNKTLTRAWEGGLNYPIFSNIDFDNNGNQDLIAFDKSGNRLIVFKNDQLSFEPINIPITLDKWVLFRDFNCDNLPDIFTGTAGGIKVYKNNGNFSFTLETSQLQSDLGSFTSNLSIPNEDIPGITDVDGDGDMDILTFDNNGIYIEYHKNTSTENTGECGLEFKLESSCWGNFSENETTNEITLNQTCTRNDMTILGGGEHAGSTITTIHSTTNKPVDVLIGDISFNNLNYLTNGGSQLTSNIIDVDHNFPNYDNPVTMYLFPYASYADANNDSKKDLLISSNNALIGNNKEVLYYKNIGVNQDTFSFQTNTFLIRDMLDFGKGAYPIWVDENQDGLTDILVGNNALNYNGNIKATLSLLRNVGTQTNPSFEVINDDYLDFSENEETYLYPALGDLDKDGDDDLLLGLQNGKILFLNNQAGTNMPYDFLIASAEFENIDVGNYAAPVLFDVNGDASIDLTVGEQNGSLFYYENQNNFGYDYSIEVENFGGVSTQNYSNGIFFGYSTPYFFKENEKTHLLVGGESGKTHGYMNISEEISSTLQLDFSDFHNTKDGGYSKPLMGDLNSDGNPELIIGNQCGGLALYMGMEPEKTKKIVSTRKIEYILSENTLHINSLPIQKMELRDINGKLISQSSGNQIFIPETKGVFFVRAESSFEIISIKILR